MLGIEPRVSHMVGRHYTTKLLLSSSIFSFVCYKQYLVFHLYHFPRGLLMLSVFCAQIGLLVPSFLECIKISLDSPASISLSLGVYDTRPD